MARNKKMSVATKGSVITLHEEKYSLKEIARRVGINVAAVSRFL